MSLRLMPMILSAAVFATVVSSCTPVLNIGRRHDSVHSTPAANPTVGSARASLAPSPMPSTVSAPNTVHARIMANPYGRLLIVPVFIAGNGPYDFELDTGASRSVIDSRVASQLHLPTVGSEHEVWVLGPVETTRVIVSEWRVDSVTLLPMELVSLQLPWSNLTISGLLGADILSQYRTVTIDYQTGTITLR